MAERRFDAEDTEDETRVMGSNPSISPEDEATMALRRPMVQRTAALPNQPRAATQRMNDQRFDQAPIAPTSIPTVDLRARPVDAAGFEQRYEHRSVLGVGGMGEVHLCKDRLIGRDVAIKVMRAGPKAAADARDRFAREARIQGQLEHPAIVPVYDLGIHPQGGIFFTMKRIRGMTLHTVLQALAEGNAEVAAKYTRHRLLTAFGSLCLAVDFAHQRGVLHRDLKPGNIILGDFGEVYVLDWGLAKVRGAPDTMDADAVHVTQDAMNRTMVGSMLGTLGYMSPEQARGELERLDARTDVYSLGAMLFEILAGEPLHPGVAPEALIATTIHGIDARPSVRGRGRGRGDTPPELDAICVRATERDPARRYPTARALSEAIERFLEGDRNVQIRRDLSNQHLAAARDALAQAAGGGEAAQAARAYALREVGSALALDPTNADALRTMARLVVDVPDEVPRAAEAELSAVNDAAMRDAARTGAKRYMMWTLFLPLALWMGIRDVPSTAAAITGIVLCGVTAWWMSRRAKLGLPEGLALLLMSSGAIALMSALFGPFIIVPGLASTNTMFFAMRADKQARRVVISVGVIVIALPFFLEAVGVVPPAYQFANGLLQVLPRAAEFPALQSMLCLLLVSIAMVVIPGLLMGRMRDALTTAERRLFLQAWQLRQLVPSGAQEALSAQQVQKAQAS